jgi:hypothetical protein
MLLGFKKRFGPPIQIGTKVLTMRKRRKVRPKIGETIYMYSALRTKHSELISDKEKLMSIQNARIMIEDRLTNDRMPFSIRIVIDGRTLTQSEISEFVKYDGFTDEADFCRYWLSIPGKKTLKKRTGALMEIYHWTDLKY